MSEANPPINEVKPLNIVVMQSLKGREVPPDGTPQKRVVVEQIGTPSMPFETQSYKFRRSATPSRPSTAMQKTTTPSVRRRDDGNYAVRFSDYTWAHTDAHQNDHYANRGEIVDVILNFDSAIRTITGSDDIEQAGGLQSVTDLLLEQLSSQLRAECREQTIMVDRARQTYARIFVMLQDDCKRCREKIDDLINRNYKLEEDLTKVIDTSAERVKDIQEDCTRQIAEKNAEMEAKKEEYDTSMKRFLEQKSQLEEHVKALHRVFLDFQSDSVYITLEDLKQKQDMMEKKLRNKENEIQKLNAQIQKLNKHILEVQAQKGLVEQACDELRRKLQNSLAAKSRLERQIEMQAFDDPGMGEDEKEDLPMHSQSQEVLQDSPSKRQGRYGPVDSTGYINVLQKLNHIGDRIADFLTRTQANANLPRQYNDELDKVLLSGNTNLMIKAVEKKVDEVRIAADFLDQVEGAGTARTSRKIDSRPRFVQYISLHIDGSQQPGGNPYLMVRHIFQAKYLQDQWAKRMNGKVMRFPEFIITYYSKDGDTIFAALQKCGRLWRLVENAKQPELNLFKRFATETQTLDELSFFLEARHALLGLMPLDDKTPEIVWVDQQKAKTFLERVIGKFSPVLPTIVEKVDKIVSDDKVDYAAFLDIILEYYERERRKRRNAVRLMFQSKKFAQGEDHVDFENFCAMVKSLGYQGTNDTIFELFREATLLSGGEMTLESLLQAMDNVGFHFYSIERPFGILADAPVTSMARSRVLQHWLRFDSWFEGFRHPIGTFDPWVKSQMIQYVKNVDTVFKTNSPLPVMYSEYRKLLDFMQFALDSLARGRDQPMSEEKSERQLLLLENLTDLLVTFVVTDPHKDFIFEELVE